VFTHQIHGATHLRIEVQRFLPEGGQPGFWTITQTIEQEGGRVDRIVIFCETRPKIADQLIELRPPCDECGGAGSEPNGWDDGRWVFSRCVACSGTGVRP